MGGKVKKVDGMKKNMMMNRKNDKFEAAKNVGKGIGEGLGVVAAIGLTLVAAYAEVSADEAAEKRLYELDSKYYSLKKEIDEMSISKYPYGYYRNIRREFDDIESRYRRIRSAINWDGLTDKTIREIRDRYGYSFLDRLETDISSLSIRIR